MDFVHADQNLGGYRTFNLLNCHEDPTFLRAVLTLQISRDYIPAPKANLVRVVINGESWGIYASAQQFNKDFVRDWFGGTKGARWKVPGNPGGRGSLAYLGDDPAAYKRIYEIKTKDEPKSWANLIRLCKVLNETSADQLEQALSPLLDIDGALKFMALEIALVNRDGYWERTSDYNLYQDTNGRFHIIPHDANETMSGRVGGPGGPGFAGGPGGRRGPGGPGGFGPGMLVAPGIFAQADKNTDNRVSKDEFVALADAWFKKMAAESTGKVDGQQMSAAFNELLPPPADFSGGGRGQQDRPGGFGFGPMLAPRLFQRADLDQDTFVTSEEFTSAIAKLHSEWGGDKEGELTEASLTTGLNTLIMPRDFMIGRGRGGPDVVDRPGEQGGQGRRGMGGRGFRGGPRGGVDLDPLVVAEDQDKPLYSKLLAVPALRARYLGYVRDIAEKWLDWNNLGPIARQYHTLIAEDVKADTKKLDTIEAFLEGLEGTNQSSSLKGFADARRKYLVQHAEIKKLKR